MQTYGPLTLTANTITSVGVPPSSAFVYVGNDSPYDVLVAFTPYQPAVVTQATGDWSGVVQAMHHGNFPTPANIQSPLGGGFAGKVWLLPLNTRGASLSTTGSISSLAQAWVIATAPGEQPPDAYAAPRQTDLASQPRIVSVPITTGGTFTGEATFTASGQDAGGVGGASVDISPNTFDGSTVVIVYLYSLHVITVNSTALKFTIRAKCFDHSSAVLLTSDIFTSQASSTPIVFTPSIPFSFILIPPAGTQTIGSYLHCVGLSANPSIADYNYAIDYDTTSHQTVPAIGGGYAGVPPVGVAGSPRF